MSERFTLSSARIPGLFHISGKRLSDFRGSMERIFEDEALQRAVGWNEPVRQVNVARTATTGTVRGLHYQLSSQPEFKLVHCLCGEVYDVAVDLRENSPTFLQWQSFYLHADRSESVCLPPGVAHGYQTLSDDVMLLYLHSAAYSPDHEGGIHVQDAKLNIEWPLSVKNLSMKDSQWSPLVNDYKGLKVSDS